MLKAKASFAEFADEQPRLHGHQKVAYRNADSVERSIMIKLDVHPNLLPVRDRVLLLNA
jgi:hypothetical protein